jgi:hypothetical protein
MGDGAEQPAVVGIPSPTLRVIGAGFGRTGTLSLREALVRLGFGPCDHMTENFEHPSRFALWEEARARERAGEPIDWRPLLGGYQAIVDWPGAYFWRELVAAHPESRVILTIRDPARWYQSVLSTIYHLRGQSLENPLLGALVALVEFLIPPARRAIHVIDGTIWNGTFQGRFRDREYALRVFAEHIAEVQTAVPPERLLVFDVRQGWQPLCDFLGVPVPRGERFPHANDAASFRRAIQARFMAVGLRVAAAAAGLLLVAAALRWLSRRVGRRSGRDLARRATAAAGLTRRSSPDRATLRSWRGSPATRGRGSRTRRCPGCAP